VQLEAVNALQHQDLAEGVGDMDLPEALARTYLKTGREIG
jgi:hypothetical protein